MTALWTKYKTLILSIMGAAVIVGGGVGSCEALYQRVAEATAASTLAAAQAGLRVALADATKRDKQIVMLTAQAASAGQQAGQAASHARILADSIPKLKARLDSALTDSTQRQAANILYAAENARADSLGTVITVQTRQIGFLTAALDSAKVSVKAIIPAAATVDTAATAVIKAAKPGFFEKISPRAGIGAAAGVDLTGRPSIVIGVTLSWPH